MNIVILLGRFQVVNYPVQNLKGIQQRTCLLLPHFHQLSIHTDLFLLNKLLPVSSLVRHHHDGG